MLPLTLILMTLGSPEVWTAPSWAEVTAAASAPPRTSRARLYAARGEWEALQLHVRAGEEPLTDLKVTFPADGLPLEGVRVWRIATLFRADVRGSPSLTPTPDPLWPLETTRLDLPAGRQVALWVRGAVPRDAEPGVYTAPLTVLADGRRVAEVPVRLEVFRAVLPEVPPLRTLTPLDRQAIRAAYPGGSLEDDNLAAWLPAYEALARAGLSPSLGLGDAHARASDPVLQEHLAWWATAGRASTLDLAATASRFAAFPQPPDPAGQDPLQVYLHELASWLGTQGWLDRAVAAPAAPAPRAEWDRVRAAAFRSWRADRRVPRLVFGPPHPYLERYADILALPFSAWDPVAGARLRRGMSLKAEPRHPPVRMEATSSGAIPGGPPGITAAADACDGSLFTAWCSEAAPRATDPQRLDVHFPEPVATDHIRVGWVPGLEPDGIKVYTSHTGHFFSGAQTRWEHHFGRGPRAVSWSEGRFKLEKRFVALRLEFQGSETGGPVAVMELEFGAAPHPETVATIDPVELWVSARGDALPSLNAGAHPFEPRLFGWLCHRFEFGGVYLPGVMDWPAGWTAPDIGEHPRWVATRPETPWLFYPGAGGPWPSLRSERLRDGLEDYALLTLGTEHGLDDAEPLTDPAALLPAPSLAELLHELRLPRRETLTGLAEALMERRVRLGRRLPAPAPGNATPAGG